MAEIIIRECPEAAAIAADLIDAYHDHLEDATILYLLTSQKRKSRGQAILGSEAKMAPLQRYLSSGPAQSVEAGADFILVFTESEWDRITPDQRRACVDHQLCHLDREERETRDGALEYVWRLRHHDFEDFVAVVERHGLWQRELRRAAPVLARQMRLPDAVPVEPERAAAGASA